VLLMVQMSSFVGGAKKVVKRGCFKKSRVWRWGSLPYLAG
jgi:hypothetical protein